MYLQPIKNDDPELDFYTMYKRETTEYDTEYMQKYNEDLNTTLIFVRFCVPFISVELTTSSGWSVLRRQLRLRHRRPIQAPARPRRTVRSLPPRNSPQPQPICCSGRRPRHSPVVERSPHGDNHNLRPHVCKPSDVAACRVCRDAGQAVVEPVSPTHRGIDG